MYPTAKQAHEKALSKLDLNITEHVIAGELAPIFCYFSYALKNRVTAAKLDKVWFLARDGYLPMELYKLFSDASSPPSGYLEVSRKTTSFASFQQCGLRELLLTIKNTETKKLSNLLTAFGIQDSSAEYLFKKYNVSPNSEDYMNDPRIHSLFSDEEFVEKFRRERDKSRNNLISYFEKIGFVQGQRYGLVDIGWGGQIQEAIRLILQDAAYDCRPHIHGYYMALHEMGHRRRLAGSECTGLLFDHARENWMTQSLIFATDMFEDAARASHGTVVGYDGGEPVYAQNSPSRVAELEDEGKLLALQSAIMLYAEEWVSSVRAGAIPLRDLELFAAEKVALACRFPSRDLASFFITMHHGLDFGSSVNVGGYASKNLLETIKNFRKARWKEGAAAFLPLAPVVQFSMSCARFLLPWTAKRQKYLFADDLKKMSWSKTDLKIWAIDILSRIFDSLDIDR